MGVIIRQSIKGTIVNYIGTFIGFLTTFFLTTQFLKSEEIGLMRILLEAGLLFCALSQLGIGASGIRYYPYFKDEKKNDNGFFFWTLIIPFIGFLLVTLFFIILKTPISNYFAKESPLFNNFYFYIIPLGFFYLYMVVFETNSNVLMRIVVPKFIREVVIRVLTIVVILLYAFHFVNLNWFVFLLVSIYGIATILNVIYLLTLKKLSIKPVLSFIDKPLKKSFFLYTSFLVLAAISGSFMGKIDLFLVGGKLGLEQTGIYSIASYIAVIVAIPYRSLAAIALPEISRSIKENDIEHTNFICKKVSLHQFLIACFIFLLIWINIDFVFSILPHNEVYATGKWVVFFLGISYLIDSSFSIALQVLNYSKYYYYSLLFSFLLVILTALLSNFYFIPHYGMVGASVATIISYSLYLTLLLLFVKWKLKVFPLSFGLLKVLSIVVAIVGISWGWKMLLSPIFLNLSINYIVASVLDAAGKTFTSFGVGVILVYVWHISEDVNSLARKYLGKIGIRIN